MKDFNVWSGRGTFGNDTESTEGFIVDWTSEVAAPPNGSEVYDVAFFVKFVNRPASEQDDQLAYAVPYELDPAGQGFVYLPGEADDSYRLNVSAILRGVEGHFRPKLRFSGRRRGFRSDEVGPSQLS